MPERAKSFIADEKFSDVIRELNARGWRECGSPNDPFFDLKAQIALSRHGQALPSMLRLSLSHARSGATS